MGGGSVGPKKFGDWGLRIEDWGLRIKILGLTPIPTRKTSFVFYLKFENVSPTARYLEHFFKYSCEIQNRAQGRIFVKLRYFCLLDENQKNILTK